MKRKLTYLMAFAAASATTFSAAYGQARENDALSIATAKVGLAQAVAVAEGHVGGKAAKAEYERNKAGQWVFDIEVVKGTTVMNVTVDAASGNVLAAAADNADNNDENDKDD